MRERDYQPVAPAWQRDPEDPDIWRRVVVMPSLALNKVELEFLGVVAGKAVCVLGAGEGLIPLALAAMGAKVTVIDPTNSGLDVLLVRAQIVGVELDYQEAELTNLPSLGKQRWEIAYAAHISGGLEDLGKFYSGVAKILIPEGRLVINEYHPFRRIWRQEPGSPRVAHSYFERRPHPKEEEDEEPLRLPCEPYTLYTYHWTVSDYFYFLTQAGFQIIGFEEVGDSRQHWEMPNLAGLPEQLVIHARKRRKD
ncbi:MAG: methyltransferase domain-containing protein [candidate division WOR-3 bacterium]